MAAAGSFTVSSTGYPIPSLIETGALPSGVTFVDNLDGTATLSGTPATSGVFSISVTAQNAIGSPATQTFTLTVNQAAVITSMNNTAFTPNAPNTFTVTTAGYPTPSLSETGTLPGGVTFVDNNDGTGTLSGTPTADGVYSISIHRAKRNRSPGRRRRSR